MGLAMMGTGVAEGQDRAIEAARRAISSPLLEGASVNGARGVIINITGGPDLSLVEVSDASTIIQEAADEDANIIFGAVVDPDLKGKVKITVIATGFAPHVGHAADRARRRRHRSTCRSIRTTRGCAPRLSRRRRPPAGCRSLGDALLDLPLAASGAGLSAAAVEGGPGLDPDLDRSSAFDVPAFLRRQEN